MIAITDQNLADTFLDNEQKEVNMLTILNGITDFAMSVRRYVYNHPKHFRVKQRLDIKNQMAIYYEALDQGYLASITSKIDLTRSNKIKCEYMKLWKYLEESMFPYFLYGTVAWERSRKYILPKSYLEIISNYYPNCIPPHHCHDCFESQNDCRHLCCIDKKDFAARVGLHLKKLKHLKASVQQPERAHASSLVKTAAGDEKKLPF